jgi:hypothetical protein
VSALHSFLHLLFQLIVPRQSAAAASAVESYLESLPDNSGFQSAVASIAADPAAINSLSEYLPSLTSVLAQGSIPASFYSNLPTGGAFSLLRSVASEADAILTSAGVGTAASAPTATATGSTSTSKAGAVETGKVVGFAAAVGAGFLGVVMAL